MDSDSHSDSDSNSDSDSDSDSHSHSDSGGPRASEVPRWPCLRDIAEAWAPTSEAASEIRLASELK